MAVRIFFQEVKPEYQSYFHYEKYAIGDLPLNVLCKNNENFRE